MDTMVELANRYLMELRGKGRALSTQQTHRWSIMPFCEWIDGLGGCPPGAVHRTHVKAYLYGGVINGRPIPALSQKITIRKKQILARSFNTVQETLAMFFKWCALEDAMHPGLDLVCEPIPTEDRLQPRVTEAQMHKAMSECTDELHRAFMSVAIHTIGRGGEIQLFQWKHINWDTMEITWWNQKKKKDDKKAISSRLHADLIRWRNHLESSVRYRKDETGKKNVVATGPVGPNDFVICRRYINARSGYSRYLVDRPLTSLDLVSHQHLDQFFEDNSGVGAHVFRRSGARFMFDHLAKANYAGALRWVMSQLDHANTRTTEIYLGLDQDKETMRELIKCDEVDFFAKYDGPIDNVVPIRRAVGQ